MVRVQREKIQSGREKIRGLKMRVGYECYIRRRGPDSAMKVYQLEESEEKGTVLVGVKSRKNHGGQLQE